MRSYLCCIRFLDTVGKVDAIASFHILQVDYEDETDVAQA